MSFAENQVVFGSVTSAGVPFNLDLGFQPSYFHMWNETQATSAANPAVVKQAWTLPGVAINSAYTIRNTAGARTDELNFITTGGFVPYTGVEEVLEAAQVGTAITQAANAEVTIVAHGYQTGDIVRIYTTTGMLQYAGLDFVITRTAANTFTLDGGDTAAFLAPATAVTARRVLIGRGFFPGVRTITGITAANPGVVTTATPHGLVTGQRVRLSVTAPFGMVEANGLLVTVTALTATTFSIGVDTMAFTAFAYPTSAVAAAGVTFPIVTPVGEISTVLAGAVNNASFAGIRVGVSICGANADVIRYRAERAAS